MSDLIPKHGGYRNLKSFQVAQLIYDVTVRFVELYIDRFSRTRDQMVQAARSGKQNIAEGSELSATSKKMELKLTQVARASLEELRLDYEDFLRQKKLLVLDPQDPILMRFKNLRCSTLEQVQQWVVCERKIAIDAHGRALPHDENTDTSSDRPCQVLSSACLAANAALSLLNVATYLLDKQVAALAHDFENEGGFTERLYRVRSEARKKQDRGS
jgi:four helix bundle suffix protein